jgi:Zn-finger nucleic acid-binding protein
MQRRQYGRISGVLVDECRLHGHWLDANELEAIGRFIAAGGLKRASEHEAREAQRSAEQARHRARMAASPDRNTARLQSIMDVLGGED